MCLENDSDDYWDGLPYCYKILHRQVIVAVLFVVYNPPPAAQLEEVDADTDL